MLEGRYVCQNPDFVDRPLAARFLRRLADQMEAVGDGKLVKVTVDVIAGSPFARLDEPERETESVQGGA